MESKDHSEKDVLTADEGQESEKAETQAEKTDSAPPEKEIENIDFKSEAETETRPESADPKPVAAGLDDEPDFDVRPADSFMDSELAAGRDFKKSSSPAALWLGVLMVLAIIGLTYYAFKGQSSPETGLEPTGGTEVAAEAETPTDEAQPPTLPTKAPDAADFSPTPAAEAAAKRPPASSTAKSGSTKPSSTKPAASGQKAKPAETKTAAKPTETKPAETKPAETKPDEAKPTETKPAETKSDEAKPDAAKPEDGQAPAVTETPAASEEDPGKPAAEGDKAEGTKTEEPAATTEAETKPAADSQTGAVAPAEEPAVPLEISNLWVVNISSTPDPTESLRVLNRVMATDVGGQVYFYETTIDGRTQHRIRVGFFNSRAEAEAVGQKIKESLQLSATPWAVRPSVEEVTRHKK